MFPQLLKGRHMMVRVGGGWDTLEHFLSRHEPCQVRLVTPGKRSLVPLPPSSPSPTPAPNVTSDHDIRKLSPIPRQHTLSPASSKTSLKDSVAGTVSPVDSKASSLSGKLSPVDAKLGTRASSKASSGKSSPLHEVRRTSTPTRPASARTLKSALTLPLKPEDKKSPAPRTRKQSAPSSFSTPNTPTGRSVRTPPIEYRKSLTTTTLLSTPKKSRSMSLATAQKEEKKPFCGTDRLNQAKKKSISAASTPTEPHAVTARKTRSQSLATTPVETKKTFSTANGYAKKTRSMSLASPVEALRPMHKSSSVSISGALTQAAIEESIRLSLEATIADNSSSKKPFLHIKAKYRSPPPREVPPR